MGANIITEPARSLREFRLLTGKTSKDNIAAKVSLKTRLCAIPDSDKFLHLNIPFMSAAMQAVSGVKLAIALAEHGGIATIPCSIPVNEQIAIIREIKKSKAGFQKDIVTVSKNEKISKIIGITKEKGFGIFPVTENGKMHSKIIGVISEVDFDKKSNYNDLISQHMDTNITTAEEGITLEEANKKMIKHSRRFLPITDKKGNLKYCVFKRDMEKHLDFPDELVDKHKRYRVAAAVSTHPRDHERIEELLKAGVDTLVVDSSDGFSEFQKETFNFIRTKSKTIPIIGGNIVTRDGFNFLAESGFNAIKVGLGIGSGCTTQEQKAIGRGQATSLIEIVKARDEYYNKTGKYIPIIADGGMSNSSHMLIALTIGADCLMLGSFFAQFTEAAGPLRKHPKLGPLKEYWMEASNKARNYGRYDSSPDWFFEEGIEGFVPHLGPIYDHINETLHKIKSSISNAGCATIEELHKKAVIELQSPTAIQMGQVHDIISK